MAKFLIDVNLPFYFKLWKGEQYIHQATLDPTMKDEEIWRYAKENDLTIVTKDSDFSNRILLAEPPPKVIHIRFGNMSMKEFHATINKTWEQVISMSDTYKLVNVYASKIEGIR